MKTARLMFLIFACGASLCRAGSTDKTAGNEHRRPSGVHVQKPHLSRRESQAKPGASKGISNPAAKRPSIANAPPMRLRPVRSTRAVGAAVAPLSNARHHSPNPAVIAGSARLSNRNTGALDGSRVHRRL